MATSDNEWYNEWQRRTTSEKIDSKWLFQSIFFSREEPTPRQTQDNLLNLQENLEDLQTFRKTFRQPFKPSGKAVSNKEFLDIQATIGVDSLLNAYVTWQEHIVKCTVQISTHNSARSFGQFGQTVECSFTN